METDNGSVSWKREVMAEDKRRKCVAQIAFESFSIGEITKEQMDFVVSLDAAGTLHDHPVREFVKPSPELSGYVNMRSKGLRQREGGLAVKNGEWIHHTLGIIELNLADVDFLIWARDNCLFAKAPEKAKKINNHLEKFLANPPPKDYLQQALDTQKMDVDERRSANK